MRLDICNIHKVMVFLNVLFFFCFKVYVYIILFGNDLAFLMLNILRPIIRFSIPKLNLILSLIFCYQYVFIIRNHTFHLPQLRFFTLEIRRGRKTFSTFQLTECKRKKNNNQKRKETTTFERGESMLLHRRVRVSKLLVGFFTVIQGLEYIFQIFKSFVLNALLLYKIRSFSVHLVDIQNIPIFSYFSQLSSFFLH